MYADGGSSSSSAVLVNKSEADDLDDDDLDIDLDDVNDEEISELVKRIKNKVSSLQYTIFLIF